MPTSTDFEQTGRDANILNNYFYEEPSLLDENEYGRLGKLILKLIQEGGGGTTIKYGGRVDSVEDLPSTGEPNQFYFVGLEDSENFDEYIWAEVKGGTGHWDRLGSVSIIIDDHLDPNSTNPVQNSVITLAINGLTICLAAAYDTTASYVVGSYCTHGQTLYKSNAVQNPAGEWDSSKWDEVTVMGEIASALAGLATVARTGDYNDLTNKPTIPTVSDRFKSAAAAEEYDATHVYTEGEFMTLDGELFRCDPNGSEIAVGEDLITTYSSRIKNSTYGYRDNTAWSSYSGGTIGYNRAAFYIAGTIPVTSGKAYRIITPAYAPWSARETAGCIFSSTANANDVQRFVSYSYDGASTVINATSNASYLSLTIFKANEAQYKVYALSAQKFVKTTIAAELGAKADTFTIDPTPTDGSSNPVSSDGVYDALANKIDVSSVDSALSPTSTNPVQNKVIAGKINEIMEIIKDKTIIYGWSVNPNESNPATAVEYLADAVGKTPAAMGSTVFSYGGWANAFFMPKPCMLKFDGTVDYYLDPNDYSKKLDGEASDIGNLSYGGNAMMEWPLIWYKFESGKTEGEGRFYCSNKQVDESYKCWCNINSENDVIEHFYTPIYNGIIRDNKLRSLSGFRLTPTLAAIPAYNNTATYAVGSLTKVSNTAYTCITPVSTAEEFDSSKWEEITPNNSGNTTGQQEVDAATANNTTSTVEWYTEVLSDRMLISALLILIGKNLDDQAVFGRGLDVGGQSAKEAYVTGTLDNKGLFWGVTANGNSAVKVFGMENFYACNWRRTAGIIGTTIDGIFKYAYKLTHGTADGSTAAAYGSTSAGYLIADTTRPVANNYVQKMKIGKHGMLPVLVSSTATSSTYWCVYFYTGTGYALFGGASDHGRSVGSLFVILVSGFSTSNWNLGAALSCKPKKAV